MEAVKAKKQSKPKPKYGMASNSAYMAGLAWQTQKSVLFLCLAQVLLGVATQVLGLFFAPQVLKTLEAAAPLNVLIGTILKFAVALAFVGAFDAYVRKNTLFGRVDVRCQLVAKIYGKVALTSYPNVEDQGFLKLLDRAHYTVGGNDEAGEAVWSTLVELFKNFVGLLLYFTLLITLDPMILLVTLLTAFAGYFFKKRADRWTYDHREEEASYTQKMGYVSKKSGAAAYGKDVRIFGMKSWLEDIYASTLRLYRAFKARGERVYLWSSAADVVLTFLRNGVAYAYLISLVLQKGLSASQFLLYFAAVGGFSAWVEGVLSSLSTLNKQSLELSGLREFLGYEESFAFESGETLARTGNAPGMIELKNVSFRYPGAKSDTLSNINLVLKPGEKVAVVGLNGAGKTTLVKLICGFYDPTEGEVLLDGENIKAYNRRDYYAHFSAVFQEFFLLAETVAVNVAQTAEHVDMWRVETCLENAGLLEKAQSLPHGLSTKLCREVYEDAPEFSGGELQRLMLARALYKDAPFLVLDEPTAALDPIAESDLYQKYGALSHGKTSVFISHRLASTRFCGRILYLEGGGIAEEGTHDALVSANGAYAKLYELQSRYYREGSMAYEKEN
ncbi:MAG TPA: ABC transporter ATP-binding protein [Clostridia bacterium]|nr:ABC transporter ATP-binding protein [Clostridia bacterium]